MCLFHNSSIGIFMVYQDQIATNFSTVCFIIFEVNIVVEQKQGKLATIFLFFHKFPLTSTFYCPPCHTVFPASMPTLQILYAMLLQL